MARILLDGQLLALAGLALAAPAVAPIAVLVSIGVSGYAVVRLAKLGDVLMEVILGVAIAVGLIGLLSVAQAYLGWWQPRVTVGLMLSLGAVASVVEMLRARAVAPESGDDAAPHA